MTYTPLTCHLVCARDGAVVITTRAGASCISTTKRCASFFEINFHRPADKSGGCKAQGRPPAEYIRGVKHHQAGAGGHRYNWHCPPPVGGRFGTRRYVKSKPAAEPPPTKKIPPSAPERYFCSGTSLRGFHFLVKTRSRLLLEVIVHGYGSRLLRKATGKRIQIFSSQITTTSTAGAPGTRSTVTSLDL